MAKGYREVRGDAGGLNHGVWKRAWVILTGGIFVLMTLLALKNPNVLDVPISNSSLDCVPGTYSESTGQPGAASSRPTQAQVEDRVRQIAGASSIDIASGQAGARDARGVSRYGQVTTFTCTSYLGLIFAWIAAALLSIGIAILFRLARWLRGLRK